LRVRRANGSAFDIGFTVPYAGPEFVVHAVVRQGQDDRGLVDDTRNYQVARAPDLTRSSRNAAPAVSQVVVDAASYDRNAGAFRILEQVHQGLLDQCLVSPSAGSAELDLAPPQNFVQLALRGSREQDIA
jgi:hypothetical protein